MTYTEALTIIARHLGDQWQHDGLIQFGIKVGDGPRAVEVTIHDTPEFMTSLVPGLIAAAAMYKATESLCRQFGNDSADAMGALADAVEAAAREILGAEG